MNSLYDLLQTIKEKPELYLGKPSLELLDVFISGYIVARNWEFEFFPGFQEYIQNKFDIHTTHSWSKIIQFFSTTDEEAFYEFYDLLDVFLDNKKHNTEL